MINFIRERMPCIFKEQNKIVGTYAYFMFIAYFCKQLY